MTISTRRRNREIERAIDAMAQEAAAIAAGRFPVSVDPASAARKALRRIAGDRFEDLTARQWASAIDYATRTIERNRP
ncbi:MAG: hypothetical protein GY719_15495 [bacterium]|nr:hypothetical protein [bacterium]